MTYKCTPLIFLALTFFSCNKDDKDDNLSNAIVLNVLDEDHGKTSIGNSDVFINSAQNFKSEHNLSYLTNFGKKGLGNRMDITDIEQTMTNEVAIQEGNLYHVYNKKDMRAFESNKTAISINAMFYKLYVTSIIKEETKSKGALIKYIGDYPMSKLPKYDTKIGTLTEMSPQLNYKIPTHCDEYYFDDYDENYILIEMKDNALEISLTKSPDHVNGPWGDKYIYIRQGSLYTRLKFNVE